jgi:hypothetical protein
MSVKVSKEAHNYDWMVRIFAHQIITNVKTQLLTETFWIAYEELDGKTVSIAITTQNIYEMGCGCRRSHRCGWLTV